MLSPEHNYEHKPPQLRIRRRRWEQSASVFSGSVEQVRTWPWSVLRRGRGRRAKCSTKLKNLTGLLEYQAAGGARTGTNEMVFDQATFERYLPHSVDAIWWDPQRSDGSREKVIHQRLCHEFKLGTKGGCSLPLVRLLQGGAGPIFSV